MQELADDGNDMAQYALGQLYEDRELEVFDLDKAVENYTHAANQENRYAQYRLGNIYADQDNKELCNMDEALACYERAVKMILIQQDTKPGRSILTKKVHIMIWIKEWII